jgi:hypothetical protein
LVAIYCRRQLLVWTESFCVIEEMA